LVGCEDPLEGESWEQWRRERRALVLSSANMNVGELCFFSRSVTVGEFIPLWSQRYIKCSTAIPRLLAVLVGYEDVVFRI
jgi:hypothetical protein